MKFICTAVIAALMMLCRETYAMAGPKSDAVFLMDAMKGDNSEIKLGLLAQSRGGSAGVRNFGGMLVHDHRQAK
jgi:putative membrane protein